MHQTPYTREELPSRLEEGDPKAFGQLYNDLYGPLCYFAEKLVLDRQAAEEIVVDSFVRFWRSPHKQLNSFAHLKGYLFEAVKNNSLNHLRSQDRYQQHLRTYGETIRRQLDDAANEELETIALELIFQLAEGLPSECRKVFDLLYREQLSFEEAADRLQLGIQTVRNQKARAIAHLRKQLRGHTLQWLLLFL